jgi:uncharacterized protein DUF3592
MNAHYWTDAVLAGLGVLIFVIGVILYFVHGWQRLKTERSKTWPSVVGTIASAALEKSSPKGSANYIAAVRYSYQVGGKDYECNRVFWGPQEGLEKDMAAVVAAYPAGKDVWVQHDPADPGNAVLEPHKAVGLSSLFGYAPTLMIFGLAALGAGLYALSH